MSYHYSKYDFLGPESDLERYRFSSFRSASLRAHWYVSTEFPLGTELDRLDRAAWYPQPHQRMRAALGPSPIACVRARFAPVAALERVAVRPSKLVQETEDGVLKGFDRVKSECEL